MSLTYIGIIQSGNRTLTPYTLVMETTEAVVGTPAYQAYFNNTGFNKTLTTSGTATDNDTLNVDSDVVLTVTRTGNAAEFVNVDYYLNGSLYGTSDSVSSGNSVNVTETFLIGDILPGDELKVIITEG